MENIGNLVKDRRKAIGMSQETLAAQAGTSQGTIDKIENNRSTQSKFLPAVFSVLGLPLEMLANGAVAVQGQASYPAFGAQEQSTFVQVPRNTLVGAADLPIYASVVGGSIDDAMTVTAEIIDYVKRPEPLANAKNGYGLYVIGTSMLPVYRPGDLALVHPNLPASAGDDVIICGQTEHGEHYAMIKHLLKATPTKWRLRQYNPAEGEPEEFELDRAEWPVCHTVVGVYRKR